MIKELSDLFLRLGNILRKNGDLCSQISATLLKLDDGDLPAIAEAVVEWDVDFTSQFAELMGVLSEVRQVVDQVQEALP